MIRLRHKLFLQSLIVIDQLILIGVFLVLGAIIEEKGNFVYILEMLNKSYRAREGLAILLTLASWFFIFTRFVRYEIRRFPVFKTQILNVISATTFTSLTLFLAGGIFDAKVVTTEVLAWFWLFSSAILILLRFFLIKVLMLLRSKGYNYRHLLFVGAGKKGKEIADSIKAHPELGFKILGFFVADEAHSESDGETSLEWPWPVLGQLSELQNYLKKGIVDEVMICLSLREHFSSILNVVEMCRDLGIVVRLDPNLEDNKIITRSQLEEFEGNQIVTFFRENLVGQLFLKRLMDLMIAVLVLLLTSPLFLLVAVAIKLTSKGPIFFVQERVGMNKRRFRMYKFRSMVVDAEARKAELEDQNEMSGPVFKIKKDPRITKVGAIIRKLSIDELPQLINVIKGEMSLVGPRPPLWSEVDIYDWSDRRRLSIKPGITCLWQVKGRNNLTFEEWMELDREYIDNWSIWLDIKILFLTIPVILFGHGAS